MFLIDLPKMSASRADLPTARVPAATVANTDLIVSWNFRHIVHFDKIRLYNAVNAMEGYRPVDIRSPREVIDYESEDL